MDKRGEEKEENFFAIFAVIILSLLLVFGIYDIHKTVSNEAVQQDFTTKEIASSINALSSLPGDAQLEISFKKNYTISVKGDVVVVKIGDFDVGFSSPIIKSGSVDILDTTIKSTDNIVISKQTRRITINER